MSLHNSLAKVAGGSQHRSVLKRREKLQALKEKGLWDDAKSVFNLPKVKTLKIKAKKDKAKPEEGAEGAAAAPAAPAAAAKAPAKTPGAKKQ